MYSPDRHLRHRLVHVRRMDEDGTAYSFRCPNLDCESQYVAIPEDQASDKKPRLATATRHS
jgi:hypothetical protein